jgi:hypothetical protein
MQKKKSDDEDSFSAQPKLSLMGQFELNGG